MTRGGRDKDREAPVERRCIATRESSPKAGLIRFVVGPDGTVVPDLLEKLPGRGLWVSADGAALQQAMAKNLFARAAKAQVRVPPDLAAQVEALLTRRLVDLIALGRKAGIAVCGLEKVKGWLVDDRARVLIQASDGSERGKSVLRPPGGPETHISSLSASDLGIAFGRDTVIHAAMTDGGITDRVLYEAARLAGVQAKTARKSGKRDSRGEDSAVKGKG